MQLVEHVRKIEDRATLRRSEDIHSSYSNRNGVDYFDIQPLNCHKSFFTFANTQHMQNIFDSPLRHLMITILSH